MENHIHYDFIYKHLIAFCMVYIIKKIQNFTNFKISLVLYPEFFFALTGLDEN